MSEESDIYLINIPEGENRENAQEEVVREKNG